MKRLPSFHLCQILARGTAADAVSKLWLHGIESRSCSAVGLGSYREASSSTQAPRSPPTPAGPTSSSVLEHCQLPPPGAASTALGGPQAGSRKLTWLPLYNDEEEEGGERASAPAVPEDDFVFQHAATAGPFVAYKAGRLKGLYRKDVHQEQLVEMLQQLFEKLQGRQPPKHSGLTMLDSIDSHELEPATPWWQRLTGSNSGGGGSGSGSGSTEQGPAPGEGAMEAAHRGIYMFGGVGCGKTMVMDLFADSAIPEMRLLRTHFHEFMLDIHARLKRYANNQDPLVRVADRIATKTRVLCLDEFFVTDVADAMILHRLFGQLWDRGVVLVATSNRHPDQLYEGGLQRQLFLPFIARLKQVCTVHQVGSGVDYRRLAQHQVGMYFTSEQKDAELKERFEELSEGAEQQAVEVSVMMGRTFKVSCAAGKAAQLTFRELCDQPVSAADFIALVEQFHTIAVEGIPIFTGANRSAAYRFVTLIDVLYEHRVRMLCSAEASPFDLFQNIVTQEQARELRGTSLAEARRSKRGDQPSADDDMVVDDNLGFAKDRTVSRLVEMQSLEYGLAHAEQYDPQLLLAMREMQQQQERAKQA